MNRAKARHIATDRDPSEDSALGAFALEGLVIGRRALLAEIDDALAAARRDPGARDPELEGVRGFVAGVLVCARCDDEIPADDLAGFAEVETDEGTRPAHPACVDASDVDARADGVRASPVTAR